MDAKTFGEYIKTIRETRLSRPGMAKEVGLHFKTIQGYEKDGRLPDVEYLAKLAILTDHPFSDLLVKRLEAGEIANISTLDIREKSSANESRERSLAIKHAVNDEVIFFDLALVPINCDHIHLRYYGNQTDGFWLIDISKTQFIDSQKYLLDYGAGPLIRHVQHGFAGAFLLIANIGSIPLNVSAEQLESITIFGQTICSISYP